MPSSIPKLDEIYTLIAIELRLGWDVACGLLGHIELKVHIILMA
ncbi:hypothetical protein [Aerobium aerolatum]|uniref:Uncharacterized protein n=1 Tax=Aquamicrobium aerolatum DSM 21857 TaxID=1121003 RepID=A0A1I3R4D4_9HYPH|nr:hypothetical protein [Aquamicrobium aerolatum]SFJ41208.1 hypothetical protein SAMN03080618_02876 [Aquamicrobium aerolatum DSM 21857]